MYSEREPDVDIDTIIAVARLECNLEEGETQLQVLTPDEAKEHWTDRLARTFGIKHGN